MKASMRPKICNHCKNDTKYSERWDAYYCYACNLWLEQPCGEENCFYCTVRPENPIKKSKNNDTRKHNS